MESKLEDNIYIFYNQHTSWAVYNLSDIFKMHLHNAWLLKITRIGYRLLRRTFEMSHHLYLFCGSYTIPAL